MNILEENMVYLKREIPAAYMAITGKKVLDNTISHIPDKDNFLLVDGKFRVFLHSRYDQEREMDFLLRPVKADVETIILLGFGNGKAVEKIAGMFKKLQHLIVVDPNPEPLLAFAQSRKLDDLVARFRSISFIVNKTPEETLNLLAPMIEGHHTITVVSHLSYQRLYSNYYQSLWQRVYDIIRFKAINTVTAEVHRKKWLTNVWRNLRFDAAPVESLTEICKGVPAILIAGGPSLNKNIHLLEQAKSRALLVAVGSTMTILHSHGIVPHLRVAIDGNEANEQLFARVDTSECPLVYSNRLFHGILPQYRAPLIHIAFGDDDVLEKHIFKKADICRQPVRSGFSVANSALDMLIKLGCSKIIFVGQDLCYTKERLHADGAWDAGNETVHRTDRALDLFGNEVYTSKPFLGMKDLFEYTITGAKATQFINATEGGLVIGGAPNKALAEALAEDLTVEYDFVAAIEQILEKQKECFGEQRRKIDTAVAALQSDVAELLERTDRILSKLEKSETKMGQGISEQKLLKDFHRINSLAKRQMENDFFRDVVYPTFLPKFMIRGNKILDREKDSPGFFAKELRFLRLNITELHGYLTLTKQLILEYKEKLAYAKPLA